MRIGHGYDVHKFIEGRPLRLGGVEIPYDRGLLGHSDADVLLHAVCDALLGAAGLGDIGLHFPDTDPDYQDADSRELLCRVLKQVKGEGCRVGNLDCTILAQEPKLRPYIPAMEKCIAQYCNVPANRVNIKATTEEGLGFTGRKEGIAAHCVALLEENGPEDCRLLESSE